MLHNALELEVRRYQAMFESAPLAFLTTNTAGKVLEANTAAADLFLVDRRFMIGRPIVSYVVPDGRRGFRTWMQDLQRRGASDAIHARLERRTGVPFDAHVRATTFENEIWWAVVDVSVERRAEEAVWELHRELDARVARQLGMMQAVYEEIPTGIVIIDARTGLTTGKNRRAREILQPWDGELPDGVMPTDGDSDPWQVAAALEGRHGRPAVRRVLVPDGRVVPLQASATPLRDDQGAVAAVAIVLDDLFERERRELADAEFIENAAHQLRTPITAIAVAAAALEAGAKDDSAERERFVGHITRESDRMVRVIDALLGLARIQRAGGGLLVALIPLQPMLAEIVAETTFNDGVEAIVDCSDTVAAVGDAAILREAFANVVHNAAWHTASGSVQIHAQVIESRVVLEIADSGPGVRPELRDRIFDRFFHGDGASRGAGLGLALAQEAALANHGSLELVESADGARFRFVLPGARLL